MPLISGRTALASSGVNNNFFSGSYIEILPTDAHLQFGFTSGDLAAITVADIEIDVLCGTDQIAKQFNPRALGVAPQAPIYPDDFLLSCEAIAGDRIIGTVRNLDAANAAALYWAVIVEEI